MLVKWDDEEPLFAMYIVGQDGKAVPPTEEGHLGLADREHYTIELSSNLRNRRVAVQLVIDGVTQPKLILDSTMMEVAYTLDTEKRLTAFLNRSAEGNVSDKALGSISATFVVEEEKQSAIAKKNDGGMRLKTGFKQAVTPFVEDKSFEPQTIHFKLIKDPSRKLTGEPSSVQVGYSTPIPL